MGQEMMFKAQVNADLSNAAICLMDEWRERRGEVNEL